MTVNSDRAAEICQAAAALVKGDRNKTHGDIVKQHQVASELWTTYLRSHGVPVLITTEDVCWMMVLLKLSRRIVGGANPDHFIDAAGYIGGAAACAEAECDT